MKEIELDFEIDKLTNSIENSLTGEVFDTEIRRVHIEQSKRLGMSKGRHEDH